MLIVNEDQSLFPDPKDEIAKNWVESIIRGRLSGLDETHIFCIGPPEKKTKEINGYQVCANSCSVKTHVHNEFVAFCDDHINILQEYLARNTKS